MSGRYPVVQAGFAHLRVLAGDYDHSNVPQIYGNRQSAIIQEIKKLLFQLMQYVVVLLMQYVIVL